MDGRGAGNVNVHIIFSNNFKEFQALIQEIKSQQMVMIAFMEEMKQQSQAILENLREKGQPRQEVASKLEMKFYNECEDNILRTYEKVVNFTTHLCR